MRTISARYKIRQVIELTGVSEFLLRVWEDRYEAFRPERTETGRRLYSEEDLLKARTLLALTKKGLRIGDLANKSLKELQGILHDQDSAIQVGIPKEFANEIFSLANEFSWSRVRDLITHERKKRPQLKWLHEILVPLLVEMGVRVDKGQFSIAQEHIFSAIIKEQLASSPTKKPLSKADVRMVFAAPEGDYHDIGLLTAKFIASELRANALYVGANMPKEELVAVCLRYKATHLVLTSTVTQREGAKEELLQFLHFLDRNLKSTVRFWLGGRNCVRKPVSLGRPFKIFGDFHSYEQEVKKCLK